MYIKDHAVRKAVACLSGPVSTSLLNSVSQDYPAIHRSLQYLSDFEEVPLHWLQFLKDVATNSPVSAYIHSIDAVNLYIEQLQSNNTITPQVLELLQAASPVFFSFIRSSTQQDRNESIDMFKDLRDILSVIHSQQPHELGSPKTLIGELEFYPSLPKICDRGAYTLDKKPDGRTCKKLSKLQRTLLPGAFLIHCQHGTYIL